MRGLQDERTFEIALRHRQRLLGQRIHQIEIEIVEACILRQLYRSLGLGAVMDATETP